jgi:thiamine biosynthesis lipoprotein
MQSLEFRAMNTSVLLAAEGDELAFAGLQAARAFIEISEKRFSRFLPDSELSELNRSAGQWHIVSDDFMDILSLSIKYFDQTRGLFDPSILPDLKRAGYDKSMEILKEQRSDDHVPEPRMIRPGFASVKIDKNKRRVYLPQGMELDFGGIAKGWIVEKACELLATYSTACAVNAGGDIYFVGSPLDGSKWQVELEDPRDPKQTLALLSVDASAVVTSSIMKRSWNQYGRVRHHLIDPRTGEPAETNWLSVTVIDSEITAAEVYAKALLIGGEEEARRLLQINPELAFLCVNVDGQVSGSEIGKEYLNDYEYCK